MPSKAASSVCIKMLRFDTLAAITLKLPVACSTQFLEAMRRMRRLGWVNWEAVACCIFAIDDLADYRIA